MPIAMEETLSVLPPSATGRVVRADQRAFFTRLPKVELHCHLLGAMREETFRDLARRYDAPIPSDMAAGLYTRGRKPVGVLHALRAMEQHLLRRPEDIARLVREYLEDAAADNVRHAEFFWNPTATLAAHAIPYGEIQQAMVEAMEAAPISSLLIPAIDREAPPVQAVAMVEAMLAHRHPRVAGIGIDYRENDGPPEWFAPAYALARESGLRATAHAGEFGMPWTNVAIAVDQLGVDRIDHGYTVIDNPDFAESLRTRGMVFTVVPTNSYYLRTMTPDDWARHHPIRAMIAMGMSIHPNSDDPQLHRVSPAGAWELMYSHMGASRDDLRAMMMAGIRASWADEAQKAAWSADWPEEFDDLAAQAAWDEDAASRR
ncbi:adenosine deaminase family protein [Novosphingobium sediminicola]|nr:adenosine deaminase [Novosphingobium sediminicola]